MTYEEIGSKTKLKYPQYSGMSDLEVGQKVATKYPQYQSQVTPTQPQTQKKTIGGFLGNVAKSGVENVKQVGSAILSPVQTAKNIGKLALGTVQLAIPGEQGQEDVARGVGQFYKERYGGLKNIGETLYNDPVGALLDVSTVAGGVGAAAKLGKFGKVAEVAGTIEKATQPLNVAKSIFKKVPGVSKFAESTAKIAPEVADFLNVRSTKLNKTQIKKVEKATNMPIADYLKKENVYGSTQEKIAQLAKKESAAQSKFNNLARTDKVVPVKVYAEELIKRADEIELKDRGVSAKAVADRLREEAKRQIELGDLTDTQLTNTTTSSFGKAKGALSDPIAVNFEKEVAIAGKNARENFAPGSSKVGKKLQGYKTLAEQLKDQQNVGRTTQIFNALKPGFAGFMTGAATGSFVPGVGNLVGGLTGLGGSILVNNPNVQGKVARIIKQGKPKIFSKISKTGKTIEMFGKTGRLSQPQK